MWMSEEEMVAGGGTLLLSLRRSVSRSRSNWRRSPGSMWHREALRLARNLHQQHLRHEVKRSFEDFTIYYDFYI